MSLSKLLVNLGAIVVAGATALSLQLPLLNQRLTGQTKAGDQEIERQELARLNVLRQLPARGFGFNNLIATHSFLQFLQYFGDDVARVQHGLGYGLALAYFQTIIPRDPRFIQAYLYLSTSVSLFAGQPREAVALFNQGTAVIDPLEQPFGFRVWRHKATDQLLFLGDVQGARQSLLKVAEWSRVATFTAKDQELFPETRIDPNLDPPMRPITASALRTAEWLQSQRPADLVNAQISAWQSVLTSATDKKTVDRIAREVAKLGFRIDLVNIEGTEQPTIVPK